MDLNLAEGDERTALLEAIEESLRPLMRVAFEYGVTYQDLVEVVRALFIFTQKEHQESEGRSTSASHLGLLTGVTRGEVIRAISSREERNTLRSLTAKRMHQLSQLLSVWHDDPQFSTPYGAPLDLSLAPEGSFRLFDDLISVSATELDRDTAIEALRATGCVEVHAEKFVRCTTRRLLVAGKDLSRISRIGRVGAALHSNFVYNLLREPGEPGYFERTMVADFSLNVVGRNAMLAHLRVDGEDFIDSLDKWVTKKAVEHIQPEGRRYGVTTFFFEDKPVTDELAAILSQQSRFELNADTN